MVDGEAWRRIVTGAIGLGSGTVALVFYGWFESNGECFTGFHCHLLPYLQTIWVFAAGWVTVYGVMLFTTAAHTLFRVHLWRRAKLRGEEQVEKAKQQTQLLTQQKKKLELELTNAGRVLQLGDLQVEKAKQQTQLLTQQNEQLRLRLENEGLLFQLGDLPPRAPQNAEPGRPFSRTKTNRSTGQAFPGWRRPEDSQPLEDEVRRKR